MFIKLRFLFVACIAIGLTLPLSAICQEKDSIFYKKENAAGVKKILIDGKFWVWTQKIGDGKINVLLLHGGPAQSHEYFEIFSKYLPPQGVTIYYYDQFGSYFSQNTFHHRGLRFITTTSLVPIFRKRLQLIN